MLVVDEYILDRKNPVFREFAQSLHAKGIAAITFSAGLTQAGLTRLHEFVTSRDMPIGKELAERAAKEISCIKLSLLTSLTLRLSKARGERAWQARCMGGLHIRAS